MPAVPYVVDNGSRAVVLPRITGVAAPDTNAKTSAPKTGQLWPLGPAAATAMVYTRASFIDTTSSPLFVGGSELRPISLFRGWKAYKVATNRPARVRIYDTDAHRLADYDRSRLVDPVGNHGVLLEVITSASLLEVVLSPEVDFLSTEGGETFYATITNLGDVTATITTTISYVRTA